jgi:type IV pilus assembly protein PilN
MIRINLLPVPKVRKQQALIIQAVTGAVALVIVAGACYFVGLQKQSDITTQEAANTQIQRQIDELRAQVGEVEKFKKQVQTLEAQLNVIRSLERGRSGPVKMMEELSDIIPRRVWISSFREASKRVTIEGLAESGMVIADFLDSLKGSRFFENPVLIAVNSQDVDGQSVHRFQVTAGVKYDL